MLDLRAIREDPERFRAGLARRGAAEHVDEVLRLDEERRSLTSRVDELRAEQNRASKAIGAASPVERPALIEAAKSISTELAELEPRLDQVSAKLEAILADLPNLPDESVPAGLTDDDNVEIKRVGEPPAFDFSARDHVELGELLGVIDLDRGARTSGSRFAYLLGPLVMVQWALVRFALDTLTAKGFTPVIPPVLVREEALYGTGFLPSSAEQIYATRDDDLYLVGTSEVPLAALHMEEILDAGRLPLRYAGYSTCFRREAGTYGKDMKGIFRVHQFDKVEMFTFTRPEDSAAEHDFLVSIEEEIVSALGFPYRLVNVCTGELGAPAAKKIDLEAWLPGQERYRELTSCSNCTDYQARRLAARFRGEHGTEALHTLNGTATAVARTLIAILENFQKADGSVEVPAALHPYLPETLRELRPTS
ncbi:MAG: serine--tRNA ligase [Actinomycetota bacterium]|nr:serine--tRNA ligase [Actinomycetota bacterium]